MDQSAYFNNMRQKRKKEIITAARKMLLKSGTAAFSMQKLANNLDISTVTLYKYFKNMEDILSAIAEEIISDTIDLTLEKNKKSETSEFNGSSLDRFLLLFHSFFCESLAHKDDLTLLVIINTYTRNANTDKKLPDKIAFYTESLNTKAEQLLLSAEKKGELKKGIQISLSLSFIQTISLSTLQHIGLLSNNEFSKQKQELQSYIDEIITMFRIYLTKDSVG